MKRVRQINRGKKCLAGCGFNARIKGYCVNCHKVRQNKALKEMLGD